MPEKQNITEIQQFKFQEIISFRTSPVGPRDSLPGGGADKAVFQFHMVHFHGFKYLFHSEGLLYISGMFNYN